MTVVPQLDNLTRDADKAHLYRLDLPFRECVSSAEYSDALALSHALVVCKPDAVVGRRIGPALRLLATAGFTPVAGRLVFFDRLLIREMWRYQLNVATLDRLAVVDEYLALSASLVIVLRDDTWSLRSLPASVRLTALKGPADPRLRRPGELRFDLGVVNTLFSFLHSADEPADVVREIGVLFPGDQRRSLLAEINAGASAARPICTLTDDLERDHPAQRLDVNDAAARLGIQDRPQSAPELRERLGAGTVQNRWDVLTVLSHVLAFSEAGVRELIRNVPVTAWRESER